MTLLQVDRLSLSIGGTRLLSDISFDLAAGGCERNYCEG